ncbi:AraC family transcriptional regulator [Variovorax sp.]|uniref:AraC family transcriptional regulator n=1 Tax=Variovorax sp. TaxID=1871043 RepID=UPI000C3C704A|nr:AraC family transcriptional regulator [Variovorax sp.]MBS78925.1 AraC family transcriptional regulator [Variovorax sp.]
MPTPARAPVMSLRDYGAARGSHAHDHFQVLIGLRGTLDIEVEGRGAQIDARRARVVAPGDRHDFESRGGCRCLVLDSAQPGWARCLDRAPADLPRLQALARFLAHSLRQAQPPALALRQAPALLLEAWGPAPARTAGRRIDWHALVDWARARWHEPLSVADLADVACLSPSQFAQRCRDEQGLSPMHWLRTLRLAHARELRFDGFSVAETARRTGYRSPSALTAALRR